MRQNSAANCASGNPNGRGSGIVGYAGKLGKLWPTPAGQLISHFQPLAEDAVPFK